MLACSFQWILPRCLIGIDLQYYLLQKKECQELIHYLFLHVHVLPNHSALQSCHSDHKTCDQYYQLFHSILHYLVQLIDPAERLPDYRVYRVLLMDLRFLLETIQRLIVVEVCSWSEHLLWVQKVFSFVLATIKWDS